MEVFPLPVLFHHVGKDDLAVPTGSSQLGAIAGPRNGKNAASVGLLQGTGPLEKKEKIIIQVILCFLEFVYCHKYVLQGWGFSRGNNKWSFCCIGIGWFKSDSGKKQKGKASDKAEIKMSKVPKIRVFA